MHVKLQDEAHRRQEPAGEEDVEDVLEVVQSQDSRLSVQPGVRILAEGLVGRLLVLPERSFLVVDDEAVLEQSNDGSVNKEQIAVA